MPTKPSNIAEPTVEESRALYTLVKAAQLRIRTEHARRLEEKDFKRSPRKGEK